MSRLQIHCQVCWRPIEHGHLGIDTGVIAAYQAAEAARAASANEDEPETQAEPERPVWVTHCDDCEPNTCGYCIQVDQLRSYKDLVRWTGHLMDKTWLSASDWKHVLAAVAEGSDRRFREVNL